mgnify:CR=1 FL=1
MNYPLVTGNVTFYYLPASADVEKTVAYKEFFPYFSLKTIVWWGFSFFPQFQDGYRQFLAERFCKQIEKGDYLSPSLKEHATPLERDSVRDFVKRAFDQYIKSVDSPAIREKIIEEKQKALTFINAWRDKSILHEACNWNTKYETAIQKAMINKTFDFDVEKSFLNLVKCGWENSLSKTTRSMACRLDRCKNPNEAEKHFKQEQAFRIHAQNRLELEEDNAYAILDPDNPLQKALQIERDRLFLIAIEQFRKTKKYEDLLKTNCEYTTYGYYRDRYKVHFGLSQQGSLSSRAFLEQAIPAGQQRSITQRFMKLYTVARIFTIAVEVLRKTKAEDIEKVLLQSGILRVRYSNA